MSTPPSDTEAAGAVAGRAGGRQPATRAGDVPPGPTAAWRASADKLRRLILEQSWDEDAQTFSAHLDGGGALGASLLALPLRRVVQADHPGMVATTAAVAERLSAGDGLLHRYLHEDSPDGLPGDEGAFVLCSFWLADNLTAQGRIDEAEKVYASLCRRASTLGLLPEQIHPTSGEFMGNFPQAFSHIGIIAGDEPIAVYLALPPALFPHAVAALHEADLPPGSRIVLEKPFGEDLAGARELNRLLAALVPEEAVFRDATGALKDMVQNHLLQLLCLVAMEPPITLGERDLHNRKADVLRSVRPLTEQDAARRTRRAR